MTPQTLRRLLAAEGWKEIGLPEEAWRELGEIVPEDDHRLEVALARIQALQHLQRWGDGAALGEEALERYPRSGSLYLCTAYCIRRGRGLPAAKALLLLGNSVLAKDPLYHFNLACYECQLGNQTAARLRLSTAIEMEPAYRAIALTDADLEPLWPEIAQWYRE